MAGKTTEISRKHPPTMVVNSRCDHRTIAALGLFWKSQSEPAQSISEIVRVSLETFLDMLLMTGKATEVESAEEALSIIRAFNLKIPERSRRTIAKSLMNESAMLEGFDPKGLVTKHMSKAHPKVEQAAELLQKKLTEGVLRREVESKDGKSQMDKMMKGGRDEDKV